MNRESVSSFPRISVPDGPALVALSGGPDSAVAAWLMTAGGNRVRAVFVDHGFPESALMAEAARAVAAALDIELIETRVTVPSGPSPEDQARLVRLAAIEQIASADEWMVTGHTADDQAETVLANLLRGAGATGLAGIPPRRGRWLRPLLDVDRAVVRSQAQALGLPFADDPSNTSLEATRNRIRHELLPRLRTDFNPAVDGALARTARLARDDDEALDPGFRPLTDDGAVAIPIGLLEAWPRAVGSRAVRSALRAVHTPYAGTSRDVDAVYAVALGGTETVELVDGVRVQREGPHVIVHRKRAARNVEPVRLDHAGVVSWNGWRFELAIDDERPTAMPFGGWRRCLDADALGDDVVVRQVRPADVVAIRDGHKPVVDALAEASIPRRARSNWPVVVANGTIAWVVGARVAAGMEASSPTARYAMISAVREAPQ